MAKPFRSSAFTRELHWLFFGQIVADGRSRRALMRSGKMETAWFVVSDQALMAAKEGNPAQLKETNWWRAVSTSYDTFEREPR